LRPISLFPFPEKVIRSTIRQASAYLAVEMSMGQMVEDLKLVVNGERRYIFTAGPAELCRQQRKSWRKSN